MESNFMRLMIFMGSLFLGVFVGLVLIALAGLLLKIPVLELQQVMSQTGTAGERSLTKLFLIINHLSFFIVPSILFVWFTQRWDFRDYLALKRWPSALTILLCLVFVLVAYPFIQKTFEWNAALPLPSWMLEMEKSANATIKQLLQMDHVGEFLLNIFVIGVMAGIGEELLFRGVLQKEFYRWFRNPHLAIWLAAILFSGMHFQFVGFIPRMLLGALLGYMYWFTRNLWVPILIHFINNALPVVTLYVAGKDLTDLGTNPDSASPIWLALLSLLATLGLGYYIFISHKPTADESFPDLKDPQP